MPTQTGSIDLKAGRAIKTMVDAGFENADGKFATKSELELTADSITSSVAQTYTTKEEFNDLEIGGRNLLYNTSDWSSWARTAKATVSGEVLTTANTDTSVFQRANGWFTLDKADIVDRVITISFEAKKTDATTLQTLCLQVFTTSAAPKSVTSGNIPEGTRYYLPLNTASTDKVTIENASAINASTWTKVSVTLKPSEVLSSSFTEYAYLAMYVGINNRVGSAQYRRLKAEFGNHATDWSPAPEDIETRMTSAETTIQQTANNVLIKATQTDTTAAQGGQHLIESLINVAPSGVKIDASKVEIDGTAVFSAISSDVDGAITEKVEALPRYKTVSPTGTTYRYTTANWLRYSAEGTQWGWTAVVGAKVGDTLLIHGMNSDTDSDVYCLVTVDTVNSNGAVTLATSHGLIDPEAGKRADAAQDSVDNLRAGGENLIGRFNYKLSHSCVYDHLSGTITSTTTTNTRDNSVFVQFYTGTTTSSAGTFVRQLDAIGSSANVGQLLHATFEKSSDYTHIRLKFNGNKADSGVFWDVSSIADGTELTLSFTLESISSDGKGNGGVLSGINLRTGNMPSRWSLAPQDQDVHTGGRNYAKTDFERFPIGKSETRQSGVTATITGPSTFTLNGTATTTDWFFSAAGVFGGLVLQEGAYKVWCTSPNVNIRVGVGSLGGTWFAAGVNCTRDNPFNLNVTTEQAYYFTPYSDVGKSFSNQEVRLMVELSDHPTDWTPAPEDIEANAVKRTQRIYYRTSAAKSSWTMPSAWLATTTDVRDQWTCKVPRLTANADGTGTKYLYLYTCEQREMADGTIAYTTVLLDDSTTIIDGGNIITGSVTANKLNASDINASGSLTIGALSSDTQSSILNSEMEIGGRNLLLGSDKNTISGTGSVDKGGYGLSKKILKGTTVIVSVQIDAENVSWDGSGSRRLGFEINQATDGVSSGTQYIGVWWGLTGTTNNGAGINYNTTSTGVTTFHGRIWCIYTLTRDFDSYEVQPNRWGIYIQNVSGGTVTVSKPKIEIANKPTDWTPAPEDVDAGISDAAKTATNYITADSTGIKIASANPSTSTTYQHQTSTATEYYIGGRLRNRIDANGQQVFASDGTTPVAKFGNASGTTLSVVASDAPATGTAYTLPSNVSTITAVTLDGTTLTSGTDYTLDGTTSVTLKASSTVTSILSDSSSSGEDDSEDSSLSGHSLVVEYKCADGAALALGGDLSISGLDSQIPALFRYGAPIQVEHATDGSDAGMNVKRTDTGTGVFFGVGKSGVNHGVFSRLLNRWLLYGDGSRVRVAPHTVTNGAIRMENTSAPTSTPSANWYSPALWFADKLNANFGGIRAAFTSNNRRGVNVWASRVVNNVKKSFGLLLTIDSSGNYHATLGGIGVFTTHGIVNGDQSVTTAANSYKDFTVSFGHTYSSAPNVVVGFYSTSTASGFGGLSCAVNSKTTTGCTIRVFNNTSTGRAPGVEWIAIGD